MNIDDHKYCFFNNSGLDLHSKVDINYLITTWQLNYLIHYVVTTEYSLMFQEFQLIK